MSNAGQPTSVHEVIVVGLGAWGAAAAHDLARSGHRVLAIDQHSHPHPYGSSHASTRVYREADTGGSIYLPFAVESLPAFRQLEEEFGLRLFQRTGAVYLSDTVDGNHARTIADYREHDRPFEELDAREVARRWPLIAAPDEYVAIYEEAAGALFAEGLVQTLHKAAQARGAELRFHERVLDWSETPRGVEVTTDRGRYEADQLVLCLGPWLEETGRLGLPMVVERQVPVWFDTSTEPTARELPIYLAPAEPPAENIYVIPDVLGDGIKATMHRGGVRGRRAELADEPDPADIDYVRENLRRISPALAARPVANSLICRYTNTPDLHWIVGRHPEFDSVVVIGGDGGRGMKFVPFIGRAATSLVDREPRPDLTPFDPRRFAATSAVTRTRF
jgi:sarcosine oxidase